MAVLVIMPRQGQSVESCVITALNVKKGSAVTAGDVLFTYETDKSSFDEKAPESGVLLELFVGEGDDVPCLDPVCIIGAAGEDISSLMPESGKPAAGKPAEAETKANEPATAETKAPAAGIPAEAEKTADSSGITRISPRAKNLAEKTGADISAAIPTGPMGRIIERDINTVLDRGIIVKTAEAISSETPAAASSPAPAKSASAEAEYEDVKIPNIRRVIAKSMHISLSTMAQLTLNSSFDASQILAYRAELKENAEKLGLPNITLNDMVLYAVAKTIISHRDMNAHYLEDSQTMRYFKSCNLGIAVDTERGLLVPTLFNADSMTLASLSKAAKNIIKDAQNGTISPDLIRGASFTVTNLGSLGVESFTPVINPPQTGILGVDNIVYRVKEDGGTYPAMGLSLTFDHRALDGAPAARFLRDLCANLENFSLLLAK